MRDITDIDSTGEYLEEGDKHIVSNWVKNQSGADGTYKIYQDGEYYTTYEIYKTPNERYVLKQDNTHYDGPIYALCSLMEAKKKIKMTYDDLKYDGDNVQVNIKGLGMGHPQNWQMEFH